VRGREGRVGRQKGGEGAGKVIEGKKPGGRVWWGGNKAGGEDSVRGEVREDSGSGGDTRDG